MAGVYRGTTLALTGTLTLDAQGDADGGFIFQSASTPITASAGSSATSVASIARPKIPST